MASSTLAVYAQGSGLSAAEQSFVFEGGTGTTALSFQRMQEIEGRAAPLIAVVVMQAGRMVVQRWVSTRVAASIARQGGDLWAPTRQSANALARQASPGGARPIREFSTGSGKRFTHYHTNPRNGGHIWYGTPRQYGFLGTIGAPGVATWGGFTGEARAGYDENRTCDYACHRPTPKNQLTLLEEARTSASYIANASFTTWKDQRDQGIVKQRFDYTCGAASIATILTYFYKSPVEEPDVLAQLDDEEQYSLDDLSRVVATWGFKGVGLSASFGDLKKLKVPVIAHIHYRGQDHFTVIRGVNEDGTVRLADSSFGNRRMREAEFRRYWQQGEAGSVLVILPLNIAKADVDENYFGPFDTFEALLRSYLFDGPMPDPRFQ